MDTRDTVETESTEFGNWHEKGREKGQNMIPSHVDWESSMPN